MSVINLNEILFLLEEEKVASIFIKINNETNVEINKRLSIYFNFDDLNDKQNGRMLDNGYEVKFKDMSADLKDFKQIYEFLNLDDKMSIELIKINNQFNTIKEYLDKKEFDSLDMQGIIHKYENIADSFVLVTPYYEFILKELQIEKSDNTNREIISELESNLMSGLRHLFDMYKEDIKKTTNKNFNEIINELKEEINNCLQQAEKENKLLFMCDMVYEQKTNYFEPKEFFWRSYHDLQFLLACQKNIEDIESIQRDGNVNLDIFNDLKLLKPYLISAMPSYSWHCTTSGQLNVVLKFKLTEETKKYLLQYKTDYDLKGFEDLAFYQGDKLLFSSCTHEGFHTDCT